MSLCNLPIVCDTKEFKETLVLPTGGGVRSDPGSASESNRLLSQLCLLRLQRVQTPNVLSFLLLRTNKTARGPRQSERDRLCCGIGFGFAKPFTRGTCTCLLVSAKTGRGKHHTTREIATSIDLRLNNFVRWSEFDLERRRRDACITLQP